jgi:DNA-binding CsgD family transcriptional regulator
MPNPSELDLLTARTAWKNSCGSTDLSSTYAEQLHSDLTQKGSQHSAAWAALTCGRKFLKGGDHERARRYLLEAHGLFHFVGDAEGTGLADAHIAALLAVQGEAKRSIRFLPIASIGIYSNNDAAVIHDIAAMCHWQRDEPHQAISHLVREFELAQSPESEHRKWTVLANIGLMLLELNELALARLASERAWELQSARLARSDLDPSVLANLLLANLYSENLPAAQQTATLLRDLLDSNENLRGLMLRVNLVDFYGTVGDHDAALVTYDKAKTGAARSGSLHSEISLKCAAASVQEAAKDYQGALKTASDLVHNPSPFITNVGRIGLALICSRCTKALGDMVKSNTWRQRARQMGRRGLIDQVLALQLNVVLEKGIEVATMTLTERERLCLSLSAKGQTSADIGLKLGISTRTVNFHFSNIFRKLGALNRQEAIAKAVRANLLNSN